jgi:hypothetical protein
VDDIRYARGGESRCAGVDSVGLQRLVGGEPSRGR